MSDSTIQEIGVVRIHVALFGYSQCIDKARLTILQRDTIKKRETFLGFIKSQAVLLEHLREGIADLP